MIQQIVPAAGWHAVFTRRNDAGEVELETIPLCTWALVETNDAGETFRYIAGFGAVDTVDKCDDVENFLGYVHESDPEGSEKYREDAERHFQTIDARDRKHRQLREAGFRQETSRGIDRWLSPKGSGRLTTRQALEELRSSVA